MPCCLVETEVLEAQILWRGDRPYYTKLNKTKQNKTTQNKTKQNSFTSVHKVAKDMVQTSAWEVIVLSAAKLTFCILRYQIFHCCPHNFWLFVFILSRINPVHALSFCSFKIQFNIIHHLGLGPPAPPSPIPRSHQNFVCISPLPCLPYASAVSSFWFGTSSNICNTLYREPEQSDL